MTINNLIVILKEETVINARVENSDYVSTFSGDLLKEYPYMDNSKILDISFGIYDDILEVYVTLGA